MSNWRSGDKNDLIWLVNRLATAKGISTVSWAVDLIEALRAQRVSVAVVGLGHVGQALVRSLVARYRVIGFDTDPAVITSCQAKVGAARITAEVTSLAEARVFLIAVPTPVIDGRPDLSRLREACVMVGQQLRSGSVVVVESTVPTGTTETLCREALESASGLQAGRDWALGYSPERINPGDPEHQLERVVKVVAGLDGQTTDFLATLYGAVIPAGIHRAESIAVAETCKLVENIQRDVLIAVANETARCCAALNVSTEAVLRAASTKWNVVPVHPGLVGGLCLPAATHYLVAATAPVGMTPELMVAARHTNDAHVEWLAAQVAKQVVIPGCPARILVIGCAFKAGCADVRGSRVGDLARALIRFGCQPLVIDPVVDPLQVREHLGLELTPIDPWPVCDAAVVAVPHVGLSWTDLRVNHSDLRFIFGLDGQCFPI